jgi:hypothetical protein
MSSLCLLIITICYAITFVDLLIKGNYPLGFMFGFYGASCVCLYFVMMGEKT